MLGYRQLLGKKSPINEISTLAEGGFLKLE